MCLIISQVFSHIYDALLHGCTRVLQAHPIETGKVDGNVFAVKCGTVNFFIYKSGADMICIDSGFGISTVAKGLRSIGIDPAGITHLFLTHSDFDHVGGLVLFQNAKIYLSKAEEQMITRRASRMIGCIYNNIVCSTYILLRDNDVIEAGSIQIRAIETPGHTPGSMSYLVNNSILFSGDAFKLIDDKVFPLRSYINMDTELQKESIRKLAQLDLVVTAYTAHSGYTHEFDKAMDQWK